MSDSHPAPTENHKHTTKNYIPDIATIQSSETTGITNSLINLIKKTCVKLMCTKICRINDIISKRTPQPLIQLKTLPGMNPTWLYDTGAAMTCISMETFRQIKINSRPNKIHSIGKQASGASGGSLIPKGAYMIPMEFQGKKIFQQVQVFENLAQPAILGIDAIDNLGLSYLSRSR